MTQTKITDGSPFSEWLQDMGYIDEDGVLTVDLRKARALFLQQDIQARKVNIESDFIGIAKDLWEVYKEQLWEPLKFDNFEQYLFSPEVDMSKTVGYGLKDLGLYLEEGLITEKWAMKVGTSKARTVLPKLKEGKDVEEWKAKAETLNNLDLMDEVAGHEIIRYSGTGPLLALIEEIRREKPVLLDSEVKMNVRTI